jgi:hypothetical protein
MPDTFDTVDPSTLPPLTRAVVLAAPTTMFGGRVGPVASDKVLRALLDAVHAIEQRLITAGF